MKKFFIILKYVTVYSFLAIASIYILYRDYILANNNPQIPYHQTIKKVTIVSINNGDSK
jgi:hypothetical protein